MAAAYMIDRTEELARYKMLPGGKVDSSVKAI
jgi:hypothetical protein